MLAPTSVLRNTLRGTSSEKRAQQPSKTRCFYHSVGERFWFLASKDFPARLAPAHHDFAAGWISKSYVIKRTKSGGFDELFKVSGSRSASDLAFWCAFLSFALEECFDFRLMGCILGLFARGVLRFLSSGVHFWLSQSRSASNDTPKSAFLMLLLGLDFLRFDPGVFFVHFFCIPFFKMARFASVMYRGTWWGDFCSPTGLWKERCVLGLRRPGKYEHWPPAASIVFSRPPDA